MALINCKKPPRPTHTPSMVEFHWELCRRQSGDSAWRVAKDWGGGGGREGGVDAQLRVDTKGVCVWWPWVPPSKGIIQPQWATPVKPAGCGGAEVGFALEGWQRSSRNAAAAVPEVQHTHHLSVL